MPIDLARGPAWPEHHRRHRGDVWSWGGGAGAAGDGLGGLV